MIPVHVVAQSLGGGGSVQCSALSLSHQARQRTDKLPSLAPPSREWAAPVHPQTMLAAKIANKHWCGRFMRWSAFFKVDFKAVARD
jgi:hypothetical protein